MSKRFLGYVCGIFLSLVSTSFASNEQDLLAPGTAVTIAAQPVAKLIPDAVLDKQLQGLELWHQPHAKEHPFKTIINLKDYFRGCRQLDLPVNKALETRFKTIVQSYLYEVFVRHPHKFSGNEKVIYQWHAQQYGLQIPKPTLSQVVWDLYGTLKNSRGVKLASTAVRGLTVLGLGVFAVYLAAANQDQFSLTVPSGCTVNILTDAVIQNYQDGITRAGPYLVTPWRLIGAEGFVLSGAVVSFLTFMGVPARYFGNFAKLALPRSDEDADVPGQLSHVQFFLTYFNKCTDRDTIHEQARQLRDFLEARAREARVDRLTNLDVGTINLVYQMLHMMNQNLLLFRGPHYEEQSFINTRKTLRALVPDTREATLAQRSDSTLPSQLQNLSDFIERAFTIDHYVPASHSVISIAKRIRSYLIEQTNMSVQYKDIEMQEPIAAYQPHPKTKILIQQLVHLMSFYELSPLFLMAGGMQLKRDLINLVPGVTNKYASSWLLQARVALYSDYPVRYLLTGGLFIALYELATSPLIAQIQGFNSITGPNASMGLNTYNGIYAYELGKGPSGTPGCCLTDGYFDGDGNRRTNMVCPPLDQHYKDTNFWLYATQAYTQTPMETAIYSVPFLIIILNLFYMLVG